MDERIKIWEKDDFFQISSERKDMDPAVVQLPEEGIPLAWQYNWEKTYGVVRDIRLEDGEITGEVEFFDKHHQAQVEALLKHGDVRYGGYYSEVKERKDGNVSTVTECRLRAVAIVMNHTMPGWPREGN